MEGCGGDRGSVGRKAEVGTSIQYLVVTPMWIDEGWKKQEVLAGGRAIREGYNESTRLLHLPLLPVLQARGR